jgi:hypothetical protein
VPRVSFAHALVRLGDRVFARPSSRPRLRAGALSRRLQSAAVAAAAGAPARLCGLVHGQLNRERSARRPLVAAWRTAGYPLGRFFAL